MNRCLIVKSQLFVQWEPHGGSKHHGPIGLNILPEYLLHLHPLVFIFCLDTAPLQASPSRCGSKINGNNVEASFRLSPEAIKQDQTHPSQRAEERAVGATGTELLRFKLLFFLTRLDREKKSRFGQILSKLQQHSFAVTSICSGKGRILTACSFGTPVVKKRQSMRIYYHCESGEGSIFCESLFFFSLAYPALSYRVIYLPVLQHPQCSVY